MHHKEEMSCKAAKEARGMKHKKKKTAAQKHSKEDLKEAGNHMMKHMR